MKLKIYNNQVTGRSRLLTTADGKTIVKELHSNELQFYMNMDTQLKPFAPEFRGVVDVAVRSTKDKDNEFDAFFKDKFSENKYLRRYDSLKDQEPSGNRNQGSDINYRGLDPEEFRKVPGFHYSQYTEDVRDQGAKPSSVGCNPWVQRVQKIGRNEDVIIPSILLENIGGTFSKPCILDLKVGTRIYGNDCPENNKHKHIEKNKLTTTSLIGLRLTGMQVYKSETYVCRNKFYGRGLSTEGLRDVLRLFLSGSHELRDIILLGIYEEVDKLRSKILITDLYKFYGCSLLITYEGEENVKNRATKCYDVRIVDFENACTTNDTKCDGDGFIFGLSNLLSIINDLIIEHRKQGVSDS